MHEDTLLDLRRRHEGPAIQMDTREHYGTGSWGPGAAAERWRAIQKELVDNGRFDDAMQMDIDDVTSQFPGKYDAAILQMIDCLPAVRGRNRGDLSS